jgi:predicted DNA-binding protein (MmcQ/YjbR family)
MDPLLRLVSQSAYPRVQNENVASVAEQIRELALSFPEAYEDRPWGDFPVFKVANDKVFAWMVEDDREVRITLKLTKEEREIAFLLPFVSVAKYVGRYGWITASVADEESLDAALEWLRESYWLKAPPRLRSAVEEA